jgi:hypothetical protein
MLTVRIENKAWRKDSDGFLRITARILQDGIYPYAASEMPRDVQAEFPTKGEILQRILADEFTDQALATLEGKPIIVDAHEWQTAADRRTDALPVGSIAGQPHRDGDGLIADMLITDPEAIERIEAGELAEVSAGYDSNLIKAENAADYDATQRNLRFNHVVLLPAGRGRCGHDVRILNSNKAEGATMITRVFNSLTVQFANEADAAAFDKQMADGQGEVKTRDEKIKELNTAVEGHVAKLTQVAGDLKAAQDALASFTSEESQEGAYQERAAFENEEKAVVEAETEGDKDEDKKALEAALGNSKGMKARKQAIVTHVMNARKVDTSKYGEAEINATWKVLVANASRKATTARPQMPRPRIENTRGQPDAKGRVHPVLR